MGPHDPRSCGWVVGNDGFRWQGVRCWLISWSVTCVDIVYRARSTGPQPRRGHVPYLLVSLPAHGGWPWPGLVAKQRPPKGRLGAPCPWRRLSSWRRVSCYRAISRLSIGLIPKDGTRALFRCLFCHPRSNDRSGAPRGWFRGPLRHALRFRVAARTRFHLPYYRIRTHVHSWMGTRRTSVPISPDLSIARVCPTLGLSVGLSWVGWLIKSVIVCLMVLSTRITVVILELIRAPNPDFWKGCIY